MNIKNLEALYKLIPEAPFIARQMVADDDTSWEVEWQSDIQTQPTDAEIQAEVTRLQTEYDSLAYARSRKQEYDKLNQWEMQFDDNRDGTTTWVDSINKIKSQFPKG
jgi:hypothetical protein